MPSEGLYGSTFYTMTGFHGFHVTMGVICMIYVTLEGVSREVHAEPITAASR